MKTKKLLTLIVCTGLVLASLTGCTSTPTASNSSASNPSASNTEELAKDTSNESIENISDTAATITPEMPSETYNDIPLKLVEDETDIQALYNAELYNYKVIQNIPVAYSDKEAWNSYCSACTGILNLDAKNITEENRETIEDAKMLREKLIQTRSYADCAWYIWGEDIPVSANSNDLVFEASSEDNSDFKPYLVPYLVTDQENVIANIIIIAGGGYSGRNNDTEGYPIAEAFNELGYNCFVLQRRVTPYSPEDVWMDMQRSVRYLRYNGEALGLGGLNCITAAGFSGGSSTILGSVAYTYGNVLPTIYDSSYVPDEIDGVNSDLDVALCVYGPSYEYETKDTFAGLITDNTNLPAIFIIAGADDTTNAANDNITLYNSVYGKTIVEMHTFALNNHGFGVGVAGTTSIDWINLANDFIKSMKLNRGDDTAKVAENATFGELPDKYTQTQTYTVEMPFGPTEVTAGLNTEGTSLIIFMNAFGDEITLAGLVDYDGNVIPKYDSIGFFTSDMQNIYDSANPNGWTPVQ